MGQKQIQHFLAKTLLRGFSRADDTLCMFDKKKNKTSCSKDLNAFGGQNNLYTVHFGNEKNFEIENMYGRLETHLGPIFKTLKSKGFLSLSEADIFNLLQFVAATTMRTPYVTELAEKTIRDKAIRSQMKNIDRVRAKKFISDCLKYKGLMFAAVAKPLLDYRLDTFVKNFDIKLCTLELNSESLIINDTFSCGIGPVQEIHYLKNSKNVDWSKMNVHMHFPVTKRHCITLMPKAEAERLNTNELNIQHIEISHEQVAALNQLTYDAAKRFVYGDYFQEY